MKLLTDNARLVCQHELGQVAVRATQDLVTISGHCLLVEHDPEGRPIVGCPNIGATIKPCTATLPVQVGYSAFIRVNGRRACLDNVTGYTDGTPPGVIQYEVRDSGQHFVTEAA